MGRSVLPRGLPAHGETAGHEEALYEIEHGRDPNRGDVANLLFQKVKPGTKLWTDGAGIYTTINQWWPVQHSRDIHKQFQFAHTSEIEGIFGNYRTFVRRMYHHHWSEHLEEYVREFCFRFSSPEIFNSPRDYLTKCLRPVPLD